MLNRFRKYGKIVSNIGYLTILDLLTIILPFITYPYLVKTLGTVIYGTVITAQIVSGFCVILINFGFRRILPKDIAIHSKNKIVLGQILSSVFFVRICITIIVFLMYYCLITYIEHFKNDFKLYLFAFGLTFSDLLFPQFYFLGTEKMRLITIIHFLLGIISTALIFILIQTKEDYFLVPLIKSVSYIIAGIISFYIIYFRHKIPIIQPHKKRIYSLCRESFPILLTEFTATIKDRLSYLFIGSMVGMSEVVVYDIGTKLNTLITKPSQILSKATLPEISRSKNMKVYHDTILALLLGTILAVLIVNLFLEQIVILIFDKQIDLLPLRLFLITPLFLSISSYIASTKFVVFGKTNYLLYSIIFTSLFYILGIAYFYFTRSLTSINHFILIGVLTYLFELGFRLFLSKTIND